MRLRRIVKKMMNKIFTKKRIILGIVFIFIAFLFYYLFFSKIEKNILFYNNSNRDICSFEIEYCNKKIVFKNVKSEDSKLSEVIKFSRFRCFIDEEIKYNMSFDCKKFYKNNGKAIIRNLKYYIYTSFRF